MDKLKKCPDCDEPILRSEFNVCMSRADCLQPYCRKHHKARIEASRQRTIERNRALLAEAEK
jgi:hypothetical protein